MLPTLITMPTAMPTRPRAVSTCRPWWCFAGYCGLRWGELAALRWADVDLAKNALRVGRAYSEEAPRGEMSPVKDHQARTVPIPAVVSEELSKFGADQKPERLVFPSATSTPLRNRNFRRDVFDDAVEAP
jgi:integrase